MTAPLRIHQRVQRLMGNRFELSVVSSDADWANTCLDAAIEEIRRIERILTTFSDDSQTNQINANAGIQPVQVDLEVFALIERSLRLSALTQGAFDITYGSIDKRFWNFDTTMTALPDPKTAKRMIRLINYRNVILDADKHTVFLKEKGMRIGFGGIGKGYAAEQAKHVLRERGVESGIVNASGDLTTWGMQPNGQPWTIGIADPNLATRQAFSYLAISNMAVATSGSYEKYALINGKRYAHTIDPKTGYPVSGIKSVTIIAPNAELADALATPVLVMGVRVGLDLINQMKHIACIVIDDNDVLHTSTNIRLTTPVVA
ncbi:FAD:protein FMN transferase [Spirosoma sp. KCTC 42546]|uniref:FAD:protein FMN transferase n=1 Tax=Spirosoma sp. KCTC 42546 TaxID=2520506 RepID=UPI0011587CA7|nr:FAD:protein FMN transferase [Spirosoma sp. KCTC 42546]QDK79812.1 FAD:protein FMN transferase [Spirosoma sp. KCTC 42546]